MGSKNSERTSARELSTVGGSPGRCFLKTSMSACCMTSPERASSFFSSFSISASTSARASADASSTLWASLWISPTIAAISSRLLRLPDCGSPSVASLSRVAWMNGLTRSGSCGWRNRLATSSRVYPRANSSVVTGSLRLRSMRTCTRPFLSISSSTHEPRDGIRFAMKTCFSRSFGSIT